ncbi:uncharacterized protein LOC123564715 [Mercenaria mercenaria]|uniref:uncharacterized protein LOC123564715 n=1 Tax=Mercenaria mercenaria TaxID=6596 RepID=UPI00234F0C70|nr:uncharacterized protein LOC123564715 [Mercenaria mercenaria]
MLQKRGEMAQMKAQRKENQLTKLLLTVTFTFLLLIALQCITQCFFMLQPEFSDTKVVSESYAIAKLGIVINSSVNVFLYCVSGKRFRREMRLFLYSIMGCKFMVPLPDASDISSMGRRNTSSLSEAGSQNGSQSSLPTIFRRMDTPLEKLAE